MSNELNEEEENKHGDELEKNVKEANHKLHLARDTLASWEEKFRIAKNEMDKAKRDEQDANKSLQHAGHLQTAFNLRLANGDKAKSKPKN